MTISQSATSSPGRFLLWTVRSQAARLSAGIALSGASMLATALIPAAIGRTVDEGIAFHDTEALFRWLLVVLGLGLVQVIAAILRHRSTVTSWLGGLYLAVRTLVWKATRLGDELTRRVGAGEVITVGMGDVNSVAGAAEMVMLGTAAATSVTVVAILMLVTDPTLGVVILLGVPAVSLVMTALLKPLTRRQEQLRTRQGELGMKTLDIIQGFRVLRGLGGERHFVAGYRRTSKEVLHAGLDVARFAALMGAAGQMLPGLLLLGVIWLGVHRVLDGSLTAGQLIGFYGYATFLGPPLRILIETIEKISKGLVSARRIIRILSIEAPESSDPTLLPPFPELSDPNSGVRIPPGRLTVVAATDPTIARSIGLRLSGYGQTEATLSGIALSTLPRASVRAHILLADHDDWLFNGMLADQLAPHGATDEAVRAALSAASAEDIVRGLPDGLSTRVTDSGKEFSGGQRQRLLLARALIAAPEVLVLIYPTSAVDVHTESRMAQGLARARAGRTTVVFSSSPLLATRADHVVFVEEGSAVAEGRHQDLVNAEPRYGSLIGMGERL
ncbi:ABC transporter transmembrane domain-containing protein [Nonomuraea sp. NPDC050328]|uniref:ABC transporter transmembrane domain-containing protein n=1 Tax=Nonomuraea sp. NPDC050328 TaxID=3364361 RepID=UPI0037AAD012